MLFITSIQFNENSWLGDHLITPLPFPGLERQISVALQLGVPALQRRLVFTLIT